MSMMLYQYYTPNTLIIDWINEFNYVNFLI